MIFYHIIDETFRIYNKIDGLKTFFLANVMTDVILM